jgi:hypothetical protein
MTKTKFYWMNESPEIISPKALAMRDTQNDATDDPADAGSRLDTRQHEPDATSPSAMRANSPRWQFRVQSLLWLTVVVALALACFVQSRQLREAERALARNLWASRDTLIPAGKFRLLVNKMIDDDDLKLYVIRFEANEQHYVTVGGTSTLTAPADHIDVHWAEVKIIATYDSTPRRLTSLTRTSTGHGWAGGKTIYTLPPGAKPEDFLKINIQPGLYDLKQAVEIGHEDGKPVMLTVK